MAVWVFVKVVVAAETRTTGVSRRVKSIDIWTAIAHCVFVVLTGFLEVDGCTTTKVARCWVTSDVSISNKYVPPWPPPPQQLQTELLFEAPSPVLKNVDAQRPQIMPLLPSRFLLLHAAHSVSVFWGGQTSFSQTWDSSYSNTHAYFCAGLCHELNIGTKMTS